MTAWSLADGFELTVAPPEAQPESGTATASSRVSARIGTRDRNFICVSFSAFVRGRREQSSHSSGARASHDEHAFRNGSLVERQQDGPGDRHDDRGAKNHNDAA